MNPYKRLLTKVAHAQAQHPFLTLLVVAAITLAFLGGVPAVRTVAALENMMPRGLDEIRAFNALRDAGRGQDLIAVIVERDPESTVAQPDILDYEVYAHVARVTETLAAEDGVLAVYSASTLLAARGVADEEAYGALLEDPDVQAALAEYVNPDRTNTLILATTDVSADDQRMQLLARRVARDLESLGHPPGVRHALTGTPIIQQELGDMIGRDRQVTRNISTLLVFLVTALLFGTLTSAVVPIIVVTLSVTWLYGTMGYAGLPISTLAGGVAAMVIGIGIDYAIHVMNKYKHERRRGRSVAHGIEAAVTETGMATTVASLTTITAFLAFLAGAMPEMHRFGLLMALGVTYSFLLTIGALPALLILEERLYYRFRTHLHFGPDGEYYLAIQDEVRPPGYAELDEREHARVAKKLQKKYKVYKR